MKPSIAKWTRAAALSFVAVAARYRGLQSLYCRLKLDHRLRGVPHPREMRPEPAGGAPSRG